MIDLRGWVRTSLLDFPGHITTVLFTGGCNFRCPMCHNADLVTRPGQLPRIEPEEVVEFLARRAGKVTGVVVTGGEPTLQTGLASFLERVRRLGYAVKLDTNGYCPDVLSDLLDAGLVDMVAMDIKAPLKKYAKLSGVAEIDLARVQGSIAVLREHPVPVEFRTTVVPGMLDGDDVEAMARWLAAEGPGQGAAEGRRSVSYVLQQFRPLDTLDPDLAQLSPYSDDELRQMVDRAGNWLAGVSVRGI